MYIYIYIHIYIQTCAYIYMYICICRLFRCRLWMAIDKPKKRGTEETPLWVGGLKTSHYWRVKSYMFHFVGPQQWLLVVRWQQSKKTCLTGDLCILMESKAHFGIYLWYFTRTQMLFVARRHQEGQHLPTLRPAQARRPLTTPSGWVSPRLLGCGTCGSRKYSMHSTIHVMDSGGYHFENQGKVFTKVFTI